MAGPRFSGTLVEDDAAPAPAGPRFSGTLVEDDTPTPDKPSVIADVAKQVPAGLARGVAGLIGFPHAAIDVMDRYAAAPAARIVGKALGWTPKDAPFFPEGSSIADGFPSQEQVLRPVEAVTGELPKPKTLPGEVVNTLAEFAPNALLGGGSIAQRVGQVVVPALASEAAGQAARQVAPSAEPYARFAAALGGGVGAAVAQAPKASSVLMRQALDGISPEDLAAAQVLREQSKALPGGGIDLTLDEALNHVTSGRAARLSQVSRVVANSGGEGARALNEAYAARPGQVESVGRTVLGGIGPENAAPSAVGLDVQAAARAGLGQTPEGMALAAARDVVGPRVTADQAGRVIQPQMRSVLDAREAARSEQAARDYAAARSAPETVGVERTISVERPGEPIVTPQAYSRPQFTDAAPRPLEAFVRPEAEAAAAGPESLARFIARNGGIRLDGDVAATDLHRFNIPGQGNVARPTGKGIDDFWRERLIEEGYFRPDADGGMARDISSELLRKLQNEQRGFPSYPLGTSRSAGGAPTAGQLADDYSQAVSLANSRLREDLGKVGIDASTLHPDIRDRVVGSLVRGQHNDPVDAFEAVVAGMREQPAPLVKTPTVTEEIPDVRFGQVDPRPALAVVAEQGRTAKGDVRGALSSVARDLREPGGDLDMSVAGLLHARERLDFSIRAAQDIGDATKVRDLQATRSVLDEQLKRVPEVATADANFAANSRPIDPFTGNTPLARITAQDPRTGRMATPTEQVPTNLSGASASREFLDHATPEARRAYEGHVASRILDGATDRHGNVDAAKLSEALRDNSDVLEQMPAVYHRLDDVVRARDGLARVEASPLGELAQTGDIGRAVNVLFPRAPTGANHQEVAAAMGAVARNNPAAARDLARIHLETALNAGTRDLRGVPAQYGGAAFASGVRGNPQQARNLEASIRALPNGDTIWGGLDRMLNSLEATGWRPQKGSDTAFNIDLRKQMAESKGPLASAISDAATHAAVGGLAGGVGGAGGAVLFGLKNAAKEAHLRHRIEVNGAQLARMLTDPAALPDLRALLRSREGTPNAQLFATRLLTLANSGATGGKRPEKPVP
ncbi:hypothetical protein [Methylobacterium sp. 22177]|uniref:hypothetical protein n=1 Tax=Methylobacterium sp. 22177 TaxID=3453885 RepID=UPI003F8304AB